MSENRFVATLTDAALAGVYRAPESGIAELRAAAKDCEFAQLRVRLDGVRDKQGFLNAVAQGLGFPAWFGHNWDALEDCLTDMSWHEARGFVVFLSHCDAMADSAAEDLALGLRIFDAAADAWREDGVPFWTLVEPGTAASSEIPEFP